MALVYFVWYLGSLHSKIIWTFNLELDKDSPYIDRALFCTRVSLWDMFVSCALFNVKTLPSAGEKLCGFLLFYLVAYLVCGL